MIDITAISCVQLTPESVNRSNGNMAIIIHKTNTLIMSLLY